MSEAVLDKGVVKRIEGERAFVEIADSDACEDCGARILCAPNQSGERGIMAKNTAHAKVGQQVLVTETDDLLLKLSLMQYGLPLLGFLLGIFVLYSFNISLPGIPAEVVWFLGGLAGLGFSGVLSWRWARGAAQTSKHYFEISKIYANGSTNNEKNR
ncbi:MAG: SoxR reducing system RseC family protein [Candidatus Marinimicrobia bacterium]|nr:SoxR reducing system RseC family protein [Candidatus Neomarinimicrobiota bacterium]MCF7827346.1 SoxR reducing system RseC family protein [Candidatus Neomarinimicrobiota bacterium]MCF7881421.1 SoxR reducing system RseC family protein [Candidatus Neomarinimicrobiota bacterium]